MQQYLKVHFYASHLKYIFISLFLEFYLTYLFNLQMVCIVKNVVDTLLKFGSEIREFRNTAGTFKIDTILKGKSINQELTWCR